MKRNKTTDNKMLYRRYKQGQWREVFANNGTLENIMIALDAHDNYEFRFNDNPEFKYITYTDAITPIEWLYMSYTGYKPPKK